MSAPIAFSAERVSGWGMAVSGAARVARPTTREQVAAAMAVVAEAHGSLALRGAGCSYGDASLNSEGHVLDISGMDRMLHFDRERGLVTVEPGVTIRALWRHVIACGWWPPVVPGTMAVSIGGALAFNVHGKNNFAVGSFGEHVQSFVLQTATGSILRCSRQENADVFHAAIGGFGMLGCFLEITLQLKRVHSGRLRVWGMPIHDLTEGLQRLEDQKGTADYLVAWLDLHATGAALGRGLLHRADQLEPGEDRDGAHFLDPVRQDVPDTLFGVVPTGWLWPGMWWRRTAAVYRSSTGSSSRPASAKRERRRTCRPTAPSTSCSTTCRVGSG